MKNFTLAEIRRTIPYAPALRPYLGSVTACLVMQQLDFWFSIKKGEPFYKFLEAQNSEKAHPAYKVGDSWCEELSISPDEFRSAFDRIGLRYKSFTEYKHAGKIGSPFQGRYYASFHDKIKGLTWYLRNHALVDALIYEIFIGNSGKFIYVNGDCQSTYLDKVNIRKSGKSIPNNTEITTEIMADNTTTKQVEAVVDHLDLPEKNLAAMLNLIPATEHSFRLTKAIFAALDARGEDYVHSNIEYCRLKHNPGNGNSLGGMICEALSIDYAKSVRAKESIQAEDKANSNMERNRQAEQERQRLEAKTQKDKEWCESEAGKTFLKHFCPTALRG